jgi:hypothetical protein
MDPTKGPAQQDGQNQPQTVDWQKRYRDQQSWHDKRFTQTQTELQKVQQQLQEQVQWRQEQERKATLQPWNPQHPEGAKFSGLLERAKAMHRQLEATKSMAPELQQAAQQAIMAGATTEEHEALGKFREAGQQFQQEFFMSQGQNLAPMITQITQQAMAQQQAQFAGRQQVNKDFNDPTIKTLLDNPTYKTYLHQQLQQGLPYAASMEMLKLKAANDIMYSRLTGSQRSQVAAQEQARLAKGRAATTVQPDSAAAPVDPYAMAKKEAAAKGIATDSPQFFKIYNRIAGIG